LAVGLIVAADDGVESIERGDVRLAGTAGTSRSATSGSASAALHLGPQFASRSFVAFGEENATKVRCPVVLSLVQAPSHNEGLMKDDGGTQPCASRRDKTMSDKLYDIPTDWLGRAYVKDSDYRAMYERSIKDPNGFWANEAKRIHWYKPPSKIKNTSFGPATSRSNGTRTASPTSPTTASTGI
jgi:hypothetical protein